MRGTIRGLSLAVSCLAVLYCWPLPAAESEQAPAQKPAAERRAEERPAPQSPAGQKPAGAEKKDEKPKPPDPFIVPEGTPEELREYINKVRKTRCTNVLMVLKARRALRRAAEHIIAAQAEEKNMSYAVQLKMQLLEDKEQLNEFAEELLELGYEKYSRMVRNFGLLIELSKTEREEPRNRKKAIDAALKFLAEGAPEANDARLALLAGKIAELTGDNRYASEVYFSIAKAFAYCEEEELVKFAQMMAGTARRLELPGNEIKIEGKIFGGGDFDWGKYKGKIVLVDFWSSWSGASVADLRIMKKYYDQYRDRGFEIVGVSCDQRPADLESFLKERELPWTIVYGEDGPSYTVRYYGIAEIPTKILVGRDGKVITLDARGLKLKEELRKLFGPPADEKPRIKLDF
ncbi:MAG: redoxin domain-containing protein [Pirellulales bacterium]|nr:redoxin domain-containing protein [Pirellulales bacterium]